MRELRFDPKAWEELGWWVANDLKTVKRIYSLLENIRKTPFEGIGKPELLKENYSGFWSRRITDEHRIVYKVEADKIIVIQLKGHYYLFALLNEKKVSKTFCRENPTPYLCNPKNGRSSLQYVTAYPD